MKKLFYAVLTGCLICFSVACTDTESTNENGEKQTEFTIHETASVNQTNIKINSVKKVDKECFFSYGGKCQSYTTPEKDFFLVISSVLSFELKTPDGEKADQEYLSQSVKSQLDGKVMPNDLLKGQLAYDVKEADQYYFYYEDSLLDSPIKFVINRSDIK